MLIKMLNGSFEFDSCKNIKVLKKKIGDKFIDEFNNCIFYTYGSDKANPFKLKNNDDFMKALLDLGAKEYSYSANELDTEYNYLIEGLDDNDKKIAHMYELFIEWHSRQVLIIDMNKTDKRVLDHFTQILGQENSSISVTLEANGTNYFILFY